MFFKTFDEAMIASDNYEPQWICPIDKEQCTIDCYCYQEPDILGEKPEDGKGGYYITRASCRHLMHDKEGMWLVEKVDALVNHHMKDFY